MVRERVVGAEHLATALFPAYIIIEPDVKCGSSRFETLMMGSLPAQYLLVALSPTDVLSVRILDEICRNLSFKIIS